MHVAHNEGLAVFLDYSLFRLCVVCYPTTFTLRMGVEICNTIAFLPIDTNSRIFAELKELNLKFGQVKQTFALCCVGKLTPR